MDSNYELIITMHGTEEELRDMLNVFREYANGKNPVRFSSCEVNGKPLTDDTLPGEEITALGPYGSFFLLDEIDLFREMADAAPKASFKAKISGWETYATQDLQCRLFNGTLHTMSFYESNDEVYDAWGKDFDEKLSAERFGELFRVDDPEDAQKNFIYFVKDESTYADITLDDFIEYIGDTELTEEEFDAAIDELPRLGITDLDDFREDYSGGEFRESLYTPGEC